MMNLVYLAKHLRPIIEQSVQSLDDATALEATILYPFWAEGIEYVVDQRIQYNNVLYRVLQTHTSQPGWNPEAAPSLFAKVLIPDPSVIPEWIQPDSTNPYMKGDKVSHNNKNWISTIDNNVWEPGVYGWQEIE